MPTLAEGDTAPPFTLHAVTRDGERPISLSDYADKQTVVLYFYPKDDTPGCTTQACGFRDLAADYSQAGAAILGVSPDDAASHAEFAQKFSLPFPLLADEGHALADAYGVWKEKTNYGKTYMGIERTTFVIDRGGKIAKTYPRVKVDAHGEAVLAFVRGLPQ